MSIITGHHHHSLLARDPLTHVLFVLSPVHKNIFESLFVSQQLWIRQELRESQYLLIRLKNCLRAINLHLLSSDLYDVLSALYQLSLKKLSSSYLDIRSLKYFCS